VSCIIHSLKGVHSKFIGKSIADTTKRGQQQAIVQPTVAASARVVEDTEAAPFDHNGEYVLGYLVSDGRLQARGLTAVRSSTLTFASLEASCPKRWTTPSFYFYNSRQTVVAPKSLYWKTSLPP
jgi:hypothetical protein